MRIQLIAPGRSAASLDASDRAVRLLGGDECLLLSADAALEIEGVLGGRRARWTATSIIDSNRAVSPPAMAANTARALSTVVSSQVGSC